MLAKQCTGKKEEALKCAENNTWPEKQFPPGFTGERKLKGSRSRIMAVTRLCQLSRLGNVGDPARTAA